MPLHFTCELCGLPVIARQQYSDPRRNRFCSVSCSVRARGPRIEETVEQRIDARLNREGEHWLWTGRRTAAGYGVLYIPVSKVTVYVHHVAWMNASGAEIPEGMQVLHACDIPACSRNDDPGIYVIRGIARPRYGHLWLGTREDNMADMLTKGRNPALGAKGESARHHKLTEADVLEARRIYQAGGVSYSQLARRYGVGLYTVYAAVIGKTWRHI